MGADRLNLLVCAESTSERGNMKLSINKVRGKLYQSAKILGDVQALTHKNQKKAIPKRIARRIAGKQTGRLLGLLFSKW